MAQAADNLHNSSKNSNQARKAMRAKVRRLVHAFERRGIKIYLDLTGRANFMSDDSGFGAVNDLWRRYDAIDIVAFRAYLAATGRALRVQPEPAKLAA